MNTALDQRDWFTAEEAGRELGYTASTVRKYGTVLGAHRLGRGELRIPKVRVADFKANPNPIRKPTGSFLALAKEVEEQKTTAKNRDNRIHERLQKIEERLTRLEERMK